MQPYHHSSLRNHLQEAAMYDQMAQYYKYIDPEKHMYYYQMHYQCMKKIMCNQPPLMRNSKAKVRVLHAAPDAPMVDIYINDQKALERVNYYMLTPYNELPSGNYKIDIYPTGQTTRPVLTEHVTIESDKSYTIAAAGKLNDLQLVIAEDAEKVPTKAKARFWHLSPNAPTVDIAIKDGDVLFRNVSFTEATDYLELSPTSVDLEVRIAGTDDVVLTLFNTSLKANQVYTIVALGLVGEKPRLEAVVIQP